MSRIWILFLSLNLGLHTVQAQNTLFNDPYDKAIYDLTKAYCVPLTQNNAMKRYFSTMQLQVLSSSLMETVEHDLNVISELKPVMDKSIAGIMGDFIHSFGFMRAMAECFPDESERNNFVISLFVAERAGAALNYIPITGIFSWAAKYAIVAKTLLYSSSFVAAGSVLVSPGSMELSERKKLINEGMSSQIQKLETEIQNTKDPKIKAFLKRRLSILRLTQALKASESK